MIYHFSQNGTGDGTTQATPKAVDDFNTVNWSPGDVAYFYGEITSKVTVKTGGSLGLPVTLDCTSAILNPGILTDAILVYPIGFVTIRNIPIDQCRRGVFCISHWKGLHNILVEDVTVNYSAETAVSLSTSNLDALNEFEPVTDVVFNRIEVHEAAFHGIAMVGNLTPTCIISNSKVHKASTIGNHWGIYMGAKSTQSSGVIWLGSGTYTSDIVADHGMLKWDEIKQVWMRGYTVEPKLTRGIYGLLNDNEFAQCGTTVQIKVPVDPNGYDFVLSQNQPTGGVISNCLAEYVSNNSGTTDGAGIGFDLGMAGGLIEKSVSQYNEGRGFELSLSSNCEMSESFSDTSGAWGFNLYSCGDGIKVNACTAQGSTNHAFQVNQSKNGSVAIDGCTAMNAGGSDFKEIATTGSQLTNNISYNCAEYVFGVQAGPL